MPKCIFQNFKKMFGNFLGGHLDIICTPTKFRKEKIFCGLCKKDNFQAKRTVFSPQNFVGEHRMFI
jgi:hypothetical protein